jgi:MYXO-CTERM domain-containing protein
VDGQKKEAGPTLDGIPKPEAGKPDLKLEAGATVEAGVKPEAGAKPEAGPADGPVSVIDTKPAGDVTPAKSDGGCSCQLGAGTDEPVLAGLGLLALALLFLRRRRG